MHKGVHYYHVHICYCRICTKMWVVEVYTCKLPVWRWVQHHKSDLILYRRKLGYDILGEPSPVPSSALCPAEKLHWKISTQTMEDIQTSKKNIDEYVEWNMVQYYNHVLTDFIALLLPGWLKMLTSSLSHLVISGKMFQRHLSCLRMGSSRWPYS